MSQRLRERFAAGKAAGRPLFIAYVTAGYPRRKESVPVLLALEEGGADVIEIGVPFTDPLADGATIQHANQVAIEQGVSFADCLALVREARERGLRAPIVLMGYYNPILAYGEDRAARDAAAAGADGFIVVDLPPEEATDFIAACRTHDMSFIPLVAPTTKDARIAKVAASADAFVYCVSVTGTTGKGNIAVDDLPSFISRIRSQTAVPLAVGFGVTRREQVVAIGEVAEGAVIGSAIISAIDGAEPGHAAERVRAFVAEVSGREQTPA